MRKFALAITICFLAFLVAGLPAQATPVACSTISNYTGLEAAGSCTIGALTFSNFTFTGMSTGTGTTPTNMSFSVDNGAPATPPSTDTIYGFEFNPDLTVSGIGSEDIRITYTVTAPSAIISSLHLLVNEATTGTATATVNETDTCSPPATPCTLFAGSTPPAAGNHEDLEGIGPYVTVNVDKDINVTSTNEGGFASISGVRDAVDLTGTRMTGTPEPATLSYLFGGMGLLALGWMRRKSVKS